MPDARDRPTRLADVLLRDGDDCTWCRRPFTGQVTPTTDHLVPKLKGGPSWQENEVASCRRCNRERGHTSPADWLAECDRRGWQPDRARVTDLLESLSRAIADRGGQRRARPYLAAQLRRLTNTTGGCPSGPFESG
ncbi:HNH endonuclease [Saccharothrix sp. S26]|uniref:HNH endonuclease n=1 Tax=Saccharothrix sp. S26 TaxID=2907215 RepID=UPI001F1EDEE1|nr:HNH endonuclease [Saccharothrix sp. S26]MCE6999842.1 HNH endonuclease [Saccharothrix sp. S26]